MIRLEEVSKSLGGKTIIDRVSFTVPQGEIVGLLGPNGAGKTTIVRLIQGVISQDGGSISVDGKDARLQGNAIRQMSGVVTESAGLYPDMTAEENLRFFARIYGVEKERERIGSLLRQVGLTEAKDRRIGGYSTGMKKRLAIAKALLHRPRLLFLDEPTNGLDPDGIREILTYLEQMNREEGTTTILCSHVLHQLENVCDSYLFLEQGRIIEQGNLAELEGKYAASVVLHVETGATSNDARLPSAYRPRAVGDGRLELTLPGRDQIPELLRLLLSYTWVHSVQIVNRSLESIYFEVRRTYNEQ